MKWKKRIKNLLYIEYVWKLLLYFFVLRRKKSIKVIYVRIICYWWYFGFSYNYIYEGGRVSEVGVIWDLVVLFDRDLFLLIIIVCYF